jgi:hypothetical protein
VAPEAQAQALPTIFARVTDAVGAPIEDLRPDELVVTEDGVQRVTVTVEPVDWPVKLTVLVDNSRAMAQPLGQVREGLRDLLAALPEDLAVELLTTAPQPRFIVRSTTDREALIQGIDRIAPDSGAAAFTDGLLEASNRILDDETLHFPVVLMVATNGPDPAVVGNIDRKYLQLQEQTIERPATYHVIVWTASGATGGRVAGAVQTIVGVQMTELTGGRYEAIAASSRLATLLPEMGAQIAESHRRQSSQYRVSYMRPAGTPPPQDGISANVLRPGALLTLSFDGRLP